MIRVIEDQRNFAERQPLALFGAVEDNVLHLGAAQLLGALFAQHPFDGVRDVALAASVRPHNAGDSILKYDLHAIRKGFKPVDNQLF